VDTDVNPSINVQCDGWNLKEVPNTTFDRPVSILTLSLNERNSLEKETFLHNNYVMHLHLQRCKISKINEEAFHFFVYLTFVDLSYNKFTSISPDLFMSNQYLTELNLRGNHLVDLQGNAPLLNGPSNLLKLDLRSCKLRELSPETFKSLGNLRHLDISDNELEILNYEILSSHQQLEYVNLEKNSWKCEKSFYDLLCWVRCELAGPQNRTVECQDGDFTEKWPPKKLPPRCCLNTTKSQSEEKNSTTPSEEKHSTTPSEEKNSTTPPEDKNSTTPPKKKTDTAVWMVLGIGIVIGIVIAALIIIVKKNKCTPPRNLDAEESALVDEETSYPDQYSMEERERDRQREKEI
jgi:hypothetical protein